MSTLTLSDVKSRIYSRFGQKAIYKIIDGKLVVYTGECGISLDLCLWRAQNFPDSEIKLIANEFLGSEVVLFTTFEPGLVES